MLLIRSTNGLDQDRTEAFDSFAKQQAQGAVTVPPTLLPPEDRRLYVRRTLREDHRFRIVNRPEGAQAKFDKLSASLFKFFRGTALLYFRDYAGLDSDLPLVFGIGDVHPENFGVMPNEDGAPIFGVNDFDEAYIAPYSYDVKRGALGFYLATRDLGHSKKLGRRVVAAFVDGYVGGLTAFARDDREKWHEFRLDNSPPLIRDLLREAQTSRAGFLAKMIERENERFLPSSELVPHSAHVEEFQEIVDRYVGENQIQRHGKAEDFFTVKDVAIKKDGGTASLGLDRYYVLLEGKSHDPLDDVVLEFKQARRSALYGLVPERHTESDAKAERIVKSERVHLVGGDPFYGHVEIDGTSFIVREHSPYKRKLDLDDLSKRELKQYARICGEALAQPHARSDQDTGIMEGNAEEQILATIQPEVFQDDIWRFVQVAAKRMAQDFEAFKQDHKLGVFDFYREA